MGEPLATRRDLDRLGCTEPRCDCGVGDFWFAPRCHPDAGLEARYWKGELELTCRECEAFVATIAVAG
jgi:hypothetical protein